MNTTPPTFTPQPHPEDAFSNYPEPAAVAPGPLPPDLEGTHNLFQAILVLEQEIDESLQVANITHTPQHKQFWLMRAASCQDALEILKRFNQKNPPAA